MLKKLCISLPITLLFTVAQAQTSAAVVAKPAAKTTTAAASTKTTASTAAVAPAPTAATSTAAAPAAPAANPTKFSLGLTASYSVQAEAQTDAATGAKTRSEEMYYEFMPAMSFGDGYRLGLYTGYGNGLTDTTNTYWVDPQVTLSRKAWELGRYFKLGPSGTLIIPMTASTRDTTDLKYGAAAKLSLSLNTKNMGMKDLSASYGVQYTRFVTDFATTASGDPVTMHRIRQDVSLGYQIMDPLSASLFFRYESRFSSENVVRNSFILSQTLEYSVNDNFSVNVGHSNSGDVLNKSKDYQGNMKFYSSEDSTYSIGMGLSI